MSPATPADPVLVAEIGFGVDPSETGWLYIGDPVRGLIGTGLIGPPTVWTDVSDYVRGFSYDIGKNRANDTWKAGTATLELNNNDGRFDPANLSGPYVSGGATQVEPMRRLRIRTRYGFSIDGGSHDRFSGYIDDVVLSYPSPRVAIVTFPATDAYKVLGNYRLSELQPVGAGEDSGARVNRILDSAEWPADDRDIDAGDVTFQATPLVDSPLDELTLAAFCEGGEIYIAPDGKVTFHRRSTRLADLDSVVPVDTFDDNDYAGLLVKNDADLVVNDVRFTSPSALGAGVGGTNAYRPNADVVEQAVGGTPDTSNLYANLNGGFSLASNVTTDTLYTAPLYLANMDVEADSLTGLTITGVHLTVVAAKASGTRTIVPRLMITAAAYDGSAGILSMTPATFSVSMSANPATGMAWTAADIEAFASTNSAGFYGFPTVDLGDVLVYQMWMDVQYAGLGPGGVEQSVADTASQARYLTKTLSRNDLILETDDDTRRLANWYLYTHKTHEQRFESITFKPAGDPTGDLWSRVLSLKMFDRITISQTPPSGLTATGDYFIIGISEQCSAQGSDAWTITFKLESATRYTGFLIIGDATLGKIGTGLIG